MFYHLWADVSSSCMFVILLWFSISLSGVMFYHPCFGVLSPYLIFCYLSDVSSSLPCLYVHLWADVSSSHMFVILLWSSISLSGVMFYHPCFGVSSPYLILCYHAWCFVIISDILWYYAVFCHLPWCFVIMPDVLSSFLIFACLVWCFAILLDVCCLAWCFVVCACCFCFLN